jgi:putative DNA primase/helicase
LSDGIVNKNIMTEDFRQAIEAEGLTPPDKIIADGKKHRFDSDGQGDKNGEYVFYPDEPLSGYFKCYKSGIYSTWRIDYSDATQADKNRNHEIIADRKARREEEDVINQVATQKLVAELWSKATPADGQHPYLTKKQIKSFGLRFDEKFKCILIPIKNLAGKTINMQSIFNDGKKRFQKDAHVTGCFFPIGKRSANKIFIIVEGYATGASIHEATGYYVICAFNCGNLKPVAQAMRETFPDARIIIAADDDHKTKGNPGITKAEEAATAVSASVVVPDFGDDRPEKATDFNDLRCIKGLDSVKKCFETIPEPLKISIADSRIEARQKDLLKDDEWSELIPLVREEEEPLPYPTDALGQIIGAAVKEFQGFGKQPLSMVASSALAAASLCCQGHADVSRDSQNKGPVSLSILAIAESGERKTSTDRAFTKSLREWIKGKEEEMKDEVRKSVAQHAAWEAERTGLLTAIREAKKSSKPVNGKPLSNLKSDLECHELQEPEILQPPRLFFEDTNAEALAYFVAEGCPTFSIWSDEGGLIIGSHGMRDDRMMGFLALMNRLWDGGEFSPNRKTVKTASIIGRRCTVNLMVQNSILDHWQSAGDGLSRGIGSFARFLALKPSSTMGTRQYQEPPETTPKLQAFHARVLEIMNLNLPLNNQGQLEPPTIHFSPEAKTHWIQQFNSIESALKPGGECAEIPDFASKYGEQAARIAGVLHIFENGPKGTIDFDTMQRSLKLAVWYLWEAKRIFTTSALPPEFKDAILLRDWLQSRGQESQKSQKSQESQLTQASVLQTGPNRLRDKKRRDNALKVLEDHQIVQLVTVKGIKMIKVNPALTR